MKRLIIFFLIYSPFFLHAKDYGKIGDAYPSGNGGGGEFIMLFLFLAFLGLIISFTDFLGFTDFSGEKAKKKAKDLDEKKRKERLLKKKQLEDKERRLQYLKNEKKKEQEQLEKERLEEAEKAKKREIFMAEERSKRRAIEKQEMEEYDNVIQYLLFLPFHGNELIEPMDMPNCLVRAKKRLSGQIDYKKRCLKEAETEMRMIENGGKGDMTIHNVPFRHGRFTSLIDLHTYLKGSLKSDNKLIKEMEREIKRIEKGEKRVVYNKNQIRPIRKWWSN